MEEVAAFEELVGAEQVQEILRAWLAELGQDAHAD